MPLLTYYKEVIKKRGKKNVPQTLIISAEYDEQDRSINYASVLISIKEEDKPVVEISNLADEMGFFNSITDIPDWDNLYRQSKEPDENDLYEAQFQD